MPTTILHKESLIPGRTSKLVLDAPQIAATAKPGHFVMLRVNEQGERFPLTIADTDPEKGTITIVYLVMGKSTMMLEALSEGDSILRRRPARESHAYRQGRQRDLCRWRHGHRRDAPYRQGPPQGRQLRDRHHRRAQQGFAPV